MYVYMLVIETSIMIQEFSWLGIFEAIYTIKFTVLAAVSSK